MTHDFGGYLFTLLQGNTADDRLKADHDAAFRAWPGFPLALVGLDERDKRRDGWLKWWQRTHRLEGAERKVEMLPPPKIDLGQLPEYSTFLQFKFKLVRPVSTGDEGGLCPTENMFRTERATGAPVFAASSWKGCLAYALRDRLIDDHGEEQGNAIFRKKRQRLFGNAPADGETEDGTRGRLVFFSSGFDRLGVYYLHPLNRRKKTGTPVILQVVPENGEAFFSLLYCPYGDAFGLSTWELAEQWKDDLTLTCKSVLSMFREIGFGAKTTSGFGMADNQLVEPGALRVKRGNEVREQPLDQLDGLLEALEGLA